MPSNLRMDLPAEKPKIDDYTSGEEFERAMDDWADAEAARKPGVFIKKFRGSRDGDDRAVHLTDQRGADENYMLVTKKTSDSGAANRAFRNRVEDFVGEQTDDNARAVAEGERAQRRAEDGMSFINDMVKSIELNARLSLGPVFRYITPEGADGPTHMARGFVDTQTEDTVIQVCEISHYSPSEGDYMPNPDTLVELRKNMSPNAWVVPLKPSDRIILAE